MLDARLELDRALVLRRQQQRKNRRRAGEQPGEPLRIGRIALERIGSAAALRGDPVAPDGAEIRAGRQGGTYDWMTSFERLVLRRFVF